MVKLGNCSYGSTERTENATLGLSAKKRARSLDSFNKMNSELATASSTRLQRALHHVRNPASLPALVLRNLKYALAARRPEFWIERGDNCAARGRHEEALACYDRALAIRDDVPKSWISRGIALRYLGRADEAETSLRRAVLLQPDLADAHVELARVLDCLGRFEEAEAAVRSGLALDPQHGFAHGLLGYVLYHLGRATESQASLRTALRLQPQNVKWHVFLGHALLLAGQLREGWSEFEWRWRVPGKSVFRSLLNVPFWKGEPIEGRTILLLADQGHGDTLHFCRYVPQIAAGAGRTVLAVQPSLVRLLSRLPGVSEVISDHGQIPPPDLWCAMMSLPHACGTTLETIPATVPYLTADPAHIARWRERLAGFSGLRVGLCWAGGQFNVGQIYRDQFRSLQLDALAPLAEVPGVHFFSLQKGPPSSQADRPPCGMVLHDFTQDPHDFADSAALAENLDLVISVDTSVAHLAGALGKPVWLLNHFDTDWRWLQNREDSPWYPTMRQFRQPVHGDWQSVLSRVQDALRRLAAGDRSQLRPACSPVKASTI
jgi:tetratricopeptide (TPR) repeat protein